MTGLAELSLVEAADAVASGKATSRELLDACWKNIEQANPVPAAATRGTSEMAIASARLARRRRRVFMGNVGLLSARS